MTTWILCKTSLVVVLLALLSLAMAYPKHSPHDYNNSSANDRLYQMDRDPSPPPPPRRPAAPIPLGQEDIRTVKAALRITIALACVGIPIERRDSEQQDFCRTPSYDELEDDLRTLNLSQVNENIGPMRLLRASWLIVQRAFPGPYESFREGQGRTVNDARNIRMAISTLTSVLRHSRFIEVIPTLPDDLVRISQIVPTNRA